MNQTEVDSVQLVMFILLYQLCEFFIIGNNIYIYIYINWARWSDIENVKLPEVQFSNAGLLE